MGDILSQEKKHPQREPIETQKKQRLTQPSLHFICTTLLVEDLRKIGKKSWYFCTFSAFASAW